MSLQHVFTHESRQMTEFSCSNKQKIETRTCETCSAEGYRIALETLWTHTCSYLHVSSTLSHCCHCVVVPRWTGNPENNPPFTSIPLTSPLFPHISFPFPLTHLPLLSSRFLLTHHKERKKSITLSISEKLPYCDRTSVLSLHALKLEHKQ